MRCRPGRGDERENPHQSTTGPLVLEIVVSDGDRIDVDERDVLNTATANCFNEERIFPNGLLDRVELRDRQWRLHICQLATFHDRP